MFSGEKHLNPALVGLELCLGDLDQKKDFGGNETKSTAGQCKEPIIYSISSPLGLCEYKLKIAYFWKISALEASTLLKIPPYNTT